MNVAAAALNSPAQPLCLCSLALKRQVLEADHDPSMDCSRNTLLSLHGLLNTFPVLFILRNMNQPLLTPSLFMRPATSGSDHHLTHETALQATPGHLTGPLDWPLEGASGTTWFLVLGIAYSDPWEEERARGKRREPLLPTPI